MTAPKQLMNHAYRGSFAPLHPSPTPLHPHLPSKSSRVTSGVLGGSDWCEGAFQGCRVSHCPYASYHNNWLADRGWITHRYIKGVRTGLIGRLREVALSSSCRGRKDGWKKRKLIKEEVCVVPVLIFRFEINTHMRCAVYFSSSSFSFCALQNFWKCIIYGLCFCSSLLV